MVCQSLILGYQKGLVMRNKIFFQMWNPTGMINQVMSLEIAAGISHETKSNVIVHYVSTEGEHFRKVPIYTPSIYHNQNRINFTDNTRFPHLKDILEWDADLTLIDELISSFPQQDVEIAGTCNDYYYANPNNPITEDELMFAEGRQRLVIDRNVHLKQTLGWYSRFFYKRSSDLDRSLSSVKFKDQYVQFANMVSKSLGDFQGAHIRLSDHATRMFSTSQEMFEAGLEKMEKNNLPIVISTCEPMNKMILDNKHRFILLDDYIVQNFEKEFKQLDFQDEVVFGLICNLVMHDAKYFIGTSGSTYTAYIHRKRNQAGIETWDLFDNPDHSSTGPYSFNTPKLEGYQKNFWREWEESKLVF